MRTTCEQILACEAPFISAKLEIHGRCCVQKMMQICVRYAKSIYTFVKQTSTFCFLRDTSTMIPFST